jgi:CRISPR system Cascade subunit CasD
MNGFILHLQGPMMSFGDTGFGQLRDAGPGPSRSAVLGVIAAALGIERGGERLLELHRDIRVHTATVMSGTLAVDYHTIAVAGYAPHNPAYLRRQTVPSTNPVLTSRTYHMDAHFVALLTGANIELLAECRAALRRPVYTGYLGRRSCPPAIPLIATDAAGEDLRTALGEAVLAGHDQRVKARPPWRQARPDMFDAFIDGDEAMQGMECAGDIVARSYRRDLLVALPRSYVNRPVIHARIALPTPDSTTTSSTNEEMFHAAP